MKNNKEKYQESTVHAKEEKKKGKQDNNVSFFFFWLLLLQASLSVHFSRCFSWLCNRLLTMTIFFFLFLDLKKSNLTQPPVYIGFLTNRAGRNKIPYHAENNSFPSGEAARERIIFQVVRNFISSQAIGQESYSYHFSNRPSSSISQKILKLNNYL